MRIAIHDYAGHPFVFGLSRELARMGHVVRHFFFEGDPGPKGALKPAASDPDGFSIEPIGISAPYRKDQIFRRRSQDIEYGRNAGRQIAAFRPDIVLSGNTPLEAQAPIIAASRRCGAGFVFWMQDFYSQAVRSLLANRFLGAGALAAVWYERLEGVLLQRSDSIVVISEDFLPDLRALGASTPEVAVVHNWGALDEIPVRPKANDWSRANGVADAFVFLYSGTLGLKHNPQVLAALSDAFRNDPSVRIVVAASGAGAEQLRWQAGDGARPNIIQLPLQPMNAFPDVLGAADVAVALLEADAGRYSVPSKVLSYLCARKPTLLSAPDENLSARILQGSGGGVVVAPTDVTGFVDQALRLRRSPAAIERMAAAARRYAEAEFAISRVAERFLDIFERTLALQGPERRSAA